METFFTLFPTIEEIDVDLSFREMNIDSLELVQYLIVLENNFSSELKIFPLFNNLSFKNLQEVIDYIIESGVHIE